MSQTDTDRLSTSMKAQWVCSNRTTSPILLETFAHSSNYCSWSGRSDRIDQQDS